LKVRTGFGFLYTVRYFIFLESVQATVSLNPEEKRIAKEIYESALEKVNS